MCDSVYTPEFKRYISDLGGYCRDETFHGEYRIDYEFKETVIEGDNPGTTTKMDINVNHVYLYAVIRVYPDCMEEYKAGNFKRIGRYMLHELCHIFTKPIEDLFWWDVAPSQEKLYTQTCERQVERISHVIDFLLPNDWYLPENILKTEKDKNE